jgi:adenosylcobinamide-GDP ribazoletransferase
VQLAAGSQRARNDGLGALFVSGAGLPQFGAAGLLTLAAGFLILGAKGLYCVLAAALFTWGMKAWSHRRLGGVTGDVIGCVSELNEILCLLLIVAFSKGPDTL